MKATSGEFFHGELELRYEPRRDPHGRIDVQTSVIELAPIADAHLKTVWLMRAMPWKRRRLVAMQLEHARHAWTAMNATGGSPPD